MALPAERPSPTSYDQRLSSRAKLRLAVGARVLDDRSVTLLDLSCDGCMIQDARSFRLDDRVVLDLPEQSGVHARVVWMDGDAAGLAFERPLSKAVVSAARLRGEPAEWDTSFARQDPLASSVESDGIVPDSEKLPRAARIVINLALVALPWAIGLALLG